MVKLPASLIRDAAGVLGAALIAYGAGMIYRPAGFIVAGILLVLGATLAARGGGV